MRKILLVLLLPPSITSFSQRVEFDSPPIDIEGRWREREVPIRNHRDRDDRNSRNSNRPGNTNNTPPSYVYPSNQVEQEMNFTLDYFAMYSELDNYLTTIDGNRKITITALDAIDIWDQPQAEPVTDASPPEKLRIDDSKSEFAAEINRLVSKSNDPAVSSVKNKAKAYSDYMIQKEKTRRSNEELFFSKVTQLQNPIVKNAVALHFSGNLTFNNLDIQLRYGQNMDPYKNPIELEAARTLFNAYTMTAIRVMNPYSLAHLMAKDGGLNTEDLALDLLKTATEIIEFSKGLRDGARLTLLELTNTGLEIKKIFIAAIYNPGMALSFAWELIRQINPEALMTAMYNHFHDQLDILENGTPHQKGQIIGAFVTESFLIGMSGAAIRNSPLKYAFPRGGELMDETLSILKNEDGGIRLSNNLVLSMIKNRTIKQVDKIRIKDTQLRKKIVAHGEDFGITDPNNATRSNLDAFKNAIKEHLNDRSTIAISGTYLDGNKKKSVIHYYNNNSRLNVIIDQHNKFVSGWKLGKRQRNALLRKGHIPAQN